jgi:hypothetical protein
MWVLKSTMHHKGHAGLAEEGHAAIAQLGLEDDEAVDPAATDQPTL